jgi:twitching motility protein PilT
MEPGAVEAVLVDLLDPAQRAALDASGDLDAGFGATIAGAERRFRAGVFRETNGLAAAIRIVPPTIPPLADLGLPRVIERFVDLDAGLVLVTGPTGSGKSTTLAAMVEEINRTRPAHIVTIEDPIEYRYTPKEAMIHQREVGIDTVSFASALRHALRQDPDVILLGELRDLDTIRTALTAAETGHLVFATLHSSDATSAVTRIVDVFPGDQQAQIRSQLALSIQGSVSQRLVPSRSGGLVPATEVMVATSGVRNLVREAKLHQLAGMLETGIDLGMHTFDQSLAALVQRGDVDVAAARRLASPAFDQRMSR